jgi:hypothetical protein
MESIIFLVGIIGGIAVLFWLMNRSSSKRSTNLANKPYKSTALPTSAAEQLSTPGNNRLADRKEIWEQRRKRAAHLSVSESDSHGNIKFRAEREYDGYSRRDRQHLNPARVKKEAHIENLSMTAIKFEPDAPSEKTQAKG